MKQIFWIFISLHFVLTINAQTTQFRQDNLLLPQNLSVTDLVTFDSVYMNKLTADSFVKPVFNLDRHVNPFPFIAERVLSQKVKVYDADEYDYGNAKILDTATIRKALGEKTNTFILLDSAGMEKEVQIHVPMRIEQLVSIKFYENWALTETPLAFTKQVLSFAPVRRYSNSDLENEFVYRDVFVIKNPLEKGKEPLIYMGKVEYEYFFNLGYLYSFDDFAIKVRNYFTSDVLPNGDFAFGNNKAPYLNTVCQKNMIDVLLRNVIEGKGKVTSYFDGKAMDTTAVKAKIYRLVEISYMNAEGMMKDTTLVSDVSSQIRSVIFIEDWYFDPQCLQIQKKVRALAPVRYFDESTERVKREVLFTIYFSDNQ